MTCEHDNVRRFTEENSIGTRSDYWACLSCGETFYPFIKPGAVQLYNPPADPRDERIKNLEATLVGLNEEKKAWARIINSDMLAVMHAIDRNTQRLEHFEKNQGHFTKRLDDLLASLEAWVNKRGSEINKLMKGKPYDPTT